MKTWFAKIVDLLIIFMQLGVFFIDSGKDWLGCNYGGQAVRPVHLTGKEFGAKRSQ